MTGESADRHYFVFYLFFITSEIKVTQHDDDEDIVRTKANLIIIYEGIRILNPKPKPDGPLMYTIVYVLYNNMYFILFYLFKYIYLLPSYMGCSFV